MELNGWTEVTCDKCGSCTMFDPTVKFEDMKCMTCLPPMDFDEWVKANEAADRKDA